VTSLTEGSASFFSRVLRVKGQPSPQDVARGVFISLGRVAARLTFEHRLRDTVVSCCVPAAFAAIRGVFGVDLNQGASSVFRFGAQYRDELSPTSVSDASIECRLRGCPVGQERAESIGILHGFGTATHIGDRQILHNNQVVRFNDCSGRLVVEVAALISDLAVPSSDCRPPTRPVFRTTPCASQRLLRACETRSRAAAPSRVIDMYSLGGGCETGDSHIETDLPPGGRQRGGRNVVAGQDQHPAPTFTVNLDRLDLADNLPVHGDLHVPDAPQIHPLCVGMPAGAVAVSGPFHTMEPSLAFESRIPWRRTGFHTYEEFAERAIQPPQRGLLARKRPYRHIGTFSPNVLVPIRLAAVSDGCTAMPPGIPAFLQCRVVQLPVRTQARRQCDMLPCRRAHSKLVGSPHVDTTNGSAARATHDSGQMSLTINSTNSKGRRVIRLTRSLRRPFVPCATRRPTAVSSPAARRKRAHCMPEHYETPPTKLTSTSWSLGLICPMTPPASPLGG
jgi:hypothetical protein